jgi:N6-adenosine-specific RNA methylase IME4
MLDIAMGLLKSYKFNYKTMVIWKKESFVMGFWFRGNVEVCLVANRGKFPAFHCQKSNFIQSKPQGHSQKPEEFFELIEPIFDNYNKIELFARKPRNGWDSFGNQI